MAAKINATIIPNNRTLAVVVPTRFIIVESIRLKLHIKVATPTDIPPRVRNKVRFSKLMR